MHMFRDLKKKKQKKLCSSSGHQQSKFQLLKWQQGRKSSKVKMSQHHCKREREKTDTIKQKYTEVTWKIEITSSIKF